MENLKALTYTVVCETPNSELLIFNADEMFRYVRLEEKIMEEFMRQYRNKLPLPRDKTSTYAATYKKLAVRADDIKD